MKLTAVHDQGAWDSLVQASPQAHPLQLWGWGELKRQNGWTPHRLVEAEGAAVAQMLVWSVPRLGWKLAYVPRGPLTAGPDVETLSALAEYAAGIGAFTLQVEPSWSAESSTPINGWQECKRPILMSETFVLDLSIDEADLMAQMARKTRQYIRKSASEGVRVELDRDGRYLDQALEVYQQTATRAGFGLQAESYYKKLLDELGGSNRLFVALIDDKVEAFLWLATAGTTAFELYGGVTGIGEAKRANYTLKWSAIQQMKAAGITYYDFNGNLHDGVGRFKQSFGPRLVEYRHSLERVLKPAQFQTFRRLWPLAKPLGRLLRRSDTQS